LNPRKAIETSDPASTGGAEAPAPSDAHRRFTLLQLGIVALIAVVLTALVMSLIWGASGSGASADVGTPENSAGPYFAPV